MNRGFCLQGGYNLVGNKINDKQLKNLMIRWEGGSGWGAHVNPWLIHVNVWQKSLQVCKVISL